MLKKNKQKPLDNIKCDCGYSNKKDIIKIYGTCKLCGAVLDKKAKYRYEMKKKLHLFPGTRKRNY